MKKKVLSLMMTLMLGFFGLAQAQVSLPYEDGFENGLGSWTMSNCQSSTGLSTTTSYVHSGSSSFTFHWTTTPPQYLISPQLSGVTGSLNVEFFYKAGSTGSFSETFMVGYSTTTADVSSFSFGEEITAAAGADWTTYTNSFPAGTKYIAIKCTSNDQYYLCLDDFAFTTGGGGGGGGTAMYDFEDSTLQGWTTIDGGNPTGYGWQLMSEKLGTGYGHEGSVDGMFSQSYDNDYGVVYPDNYLISPQITLGGSISFWACGQDASYAAEHFGVAVSTTDNTNASSFTTIQEWTIGSKGVRYEGARGNRDQSTWTLYTVDLSAYSGTGYVAIRHFDCSDMYFLDIDDITIEEGNGGGGGSNAMYDFEDSTLQGWTTIDGGNPTGYGWQLMSEKLGTGYGHEGSVDGMFSQSYDNNYGVVYPDNYLISPQITLGGSISFWACGQDASYAAEHFGVAISTTTNTDASAFTTIQEWTIGSKGVRYEGARGNRDQSTWTLYTVDLSAYSGQGYVAIRHFNCSDMYFLDVDDITIIEGNGGGGTTNYTITASPNPAEAGSINMPGGSGSGTVSGSFSAGQTCSLTAQPNTGYYFVNWTENGNAVSTNAAYSFTVNTNRTLVANFAMQSTYTITATPNPAEGGYITISYRDQLTYDFEDSSWQGWTTIDGGDPTGYGWQLMSEKLGTGYGHNGSVDGVFSQSYDNNYGVVYPDNYLISPQITLGGTISFWACGQDASYAAEHFGVAVSTTNNNSASAFTMVQEWTIGSKGVRHDGPRGNRDQSTWTLYTADLSAYSGQGYVAIRHFGCSDMYFLDVDDITIVEGNGGGNVGGTVSGTFNAGQTCVLTAHANEGYYFVNWTENGNVVSNNAVYSFTVNTNRSLVANFALQSTPTYTITVTANPAEGGQVDGGGTVAQGQSCTVTATANPNYEFVNWTENGNVVSTNAVYSFTVNTNRTLVANFAFNDGVNENTIEIALYPNPVNNLLNVVASEDINNLEVYNITGALVYSNSNCSKKVEINTSAFATGTYVIRMTTQSTTEVRRFVKY